MAPQENLPPSVASDGSHVREIDHVSTTGGSGSLHQPLLSNGSNELSGSRRRSIDGDKSFMRQLSSGTLILDIGSRIEGEPPMKGWPTLQQFRGEALRIIVMTVPLVALYVFQFLTSIISEIFVGHLGTLELAGSAIAITFTNVGIASVMETLCGQAYGAGEYIQVGETLQRALLIMTVVSLPITVLWWFTEPLLLLCGQEAAIAAYAARYAMWNLPGLFFHAWSEPVAKYLQAQGLMFPMALTSCCVLVLHVPICYCLIYVLKIGYLGAAMASSLTYFVTLVVLVSYIVVTKTYTKTWGGWTRAAFRNWGPFLWLALPSATMVCLEWWCFEIVIILAGLLPNAATQVSAMSIMLSTLLVCFMLPFSLGDATSTRVGNELGAGNAARARLATLTALGIALVVGLAMSLTLLSFRYKIGQIFTGTSQPAVVAAVAALVPFLSVTMWFDAVQTTASGSLRGSGRQKIGAIINIVSWYIIALPAGALAAFYFGLGVQGLWLGLVLGALTQDVLLTAVTLRTDWAREAQRAQELVSEQTDMSNRERLLLQ
eukprot:jgi/Mesen1/5106/ME000254S04132